MGWKPLSPEVAEGLAGRGEPRGPTLCLVNKHWRPVSGLSLCCLSASERLGGQEGVPAAAHEEAGPGGLGPRQTRSDSQ